jgi:hypothetical protein
MSLFFLGGGGGGMDRFIDPCISVFPYAARLSFLLWGRYRTLYTFCSVKAQKMIKDDTWTVRGKCQRSRKFVPLELDK